MRLLKSHPLLKIANSYLVDSPQPINLSYLWNFGSLLAVSLVIQIITGVTLAMHYNPSVTEAFNSVEHIMRDVNNGWLIRYLHSNTASAFFFLVYLHIGRGMYYGSYRAPRTLVWTIGTVIFILMIAIGFLGYVLPYGQMSLWGATVITNLMSAIPWVGQDIVEFIWGGLYTDGPQYGDMLLKILLNAGKSPILGFAYGLLLIIISIISVKIAMTWRQSAGVLKRRSLSTLSASQRLHAGDLTYAYIVGLFEGDGFFSITKKGKYLTYEFGIELSIRDAKLIYKLKKLLGVGVVSIRNRVNKDSSSNDEVFSKHEMISLRVRDKKHLKSFILPLFDKYPMFSNKQYDYLRFRNALLSDLIYSKDLPDYTRSNVSLNSIKSIVNADYFPAWLVGFIEAEGCFSIYKLKDRSLKEEKPLPYQSPSPSLTCSEVKFPLGEIDKTGEIGKAGKSDELSPLNNYLVASFDISQKDGEILISAIREYLSFTTSVYMDKTNCFRLKVSSVRSIESLIKFLDKAPVKLLGYKKLQFLLWVKQLRQISRYSKKINIPSNY